jgi:hypothetical protein
LDVAQYSPKVSGEGLEEVGLGLIGAEREPVAKKVVRRRRVVGCIVVVVGEWTWD